MKRTRKIFSLVLAVMMILSILPIHAAASGEETYDIAAPGGVITAEKGTISGGKAADGAILSIALDPAAFPAYTFDHWESAYGDVIPQESFRVLVDKDAYFFPVFADAAPHFGEWTLVKAGESCEDGDLYMRTDPETGLVEYSFRLFNYGNHDFGEYEYYDEKYCAATCSHCGYVDLVEHNWSEETVVREATHSVPGLTRKTCYRCGKTIDTEIPVTSNHSWGAWEIVTPSVNGQPGVRRRTCTECSESEECWYIKADWKGYYDDSRITFLGNYNNQYGSMKEGHYSFINNDGKRAYVYGASWADKNAERVVMFMWIDDPDELGRRPIYHAKTMVNGWGYGWALLAYADTFDEYISFIDNLYLDRSTVPHGSSLFNMFREYEDVYNEACLPASGSSDFFASQSYWSYDSDSTVSRGSTDIPVKVYTNTNGYVMYVDPETNTCLYYAQRTPNMSLYINSMTALVSDADYAAMTDDEKEYVIPYSELRKTIAYDTENTTHSIWQEYLDKPQPRYFHIVVQGANTEEYAANPGYDDPKGYYDVYSVDYIETYHLTSDLAGGGYYTHGYHIHDFGIAGTIQYPQNWYSNQNYAIDIKPEEPDGWAFDHWEKYNWQTGTWDLFTEVNGEGKPCLNYTEVNAEKTAFTIDHRLTDIAIVRARFVEVPAETVHVKVTGGTFNRIANGTTYYFESEGDVPVGSLICPIDDYDAVPAGKQFDHWIMKVDGVETEIVWQEMNYSRYVEVTADTEFVAVYTDRTYWLDVRAENGTVSLDGKEYEGGEYPAGTELTFTTEGEDGYPYFYGWYLAGGKEEEKPGSGGNILLTTDTTLHYTTTAGYATILAKWGDTETPPEAPANFHDITAVNGFLSTFYHEIQTDGLKLSAMRVPNYSNIDVYPDPVCGLIVDRFEMTGTLNGSPYTESAELDSEYGSVSFWIRDCESMPQILTITGYGESLPEHTHTLSHVEAKDASCTEDGNTEYWYCEDCGKYFSDEAAETEITQADTVVPAAGHNLTHVEAVEKACLTDGNIEYWKCGTCNKYFSDSEAAAEITQEDTVVPAYGSHDFAGEWLHDETGHWQKCSRCDATSDPAAHAFGDWTYRDEEVHVRSCTVCSHEETHAHVWDEGTETTPPSETEEGVRTYTCDVCGGTKEEPIPALGHVHTLTHIEAKNPSCTEDGNTEYWHCESCGKYFSDEAAETEIAQEDTVIPALSHDYTEEWLSDENGHWHKCSRCDSTTQVEAHTFGEWEDSAAAGYMQVHTCTVCGHSESREKPAEPTETEYSIENGTVVLDRRNDGSSTEIEQPLLAEIADVIADPENGASSLTVLLDGDVSVNYDEAALNAILGAMNDTDSVTLIVELTDETDENLTNAQHDAVVDADDPVLYHVALIVYDSTGAPIEITDFGTGTARITVPYSGESTDIQVQRVEEDGGLTDVSASHENGSVTFTTPSHSFYMITARSSAPGPTPPPTPPKPAEPFIPPYIPWVSTVTSTHYPLNLRIEGSGRAMLSTYSAPSGMTIYLEAEPYDGNLLDSLRVVSGDWEIPVTEVSLYTRSFVMPAGPVTVTVTFKTLAKALKNPFVDVTSSDYFYDAVLWAYDEKIANGRDDTHFDPFAACSRAEMVTFLWRSVGSPEPATGTLPFTDVPENAYYAKAVLWAIQNGIVYGTSSTAFSPADTVTRAQAVAFLYRMNGSPRVSVVNPFDDVPENAYYRDAVVWAYENGITSGTGSAAFSPAGDCLRGQIAAFLYNAARYAEKK